MKIKMQLISNNHSFHLRNLKQSSLYSNKYIHQRCTVLINVIQDSQERQKSSNLFTLCVFKNGNHNDNYLQEYILIKVIIIQYVLLTCTSYRQGIRLLFSLYSKCIPDILKLLKQKHSCMYAKIKTVNIMIIQADY